MIPWTDFPTEDFAGLLLERLPLRDYLNFGAVCKTWRSLQARVPHGRFTPPSPPPCFIPYKAGYEEHETVSYFSPFEQRYDTLASRKEIPWRQRKIAKPFGTCHPYIIALVRSQTLHRITLLNPISGHEITLPGYPIPWSSDLRSPRFALSLSQSSPPCYTVFTTIKSKLLFYRKGDPHWTLLNLPWLLNNFNTFRGDLYVLRASEEESEGARYLLAVYSTSPTPRIQGFRMDTTQLPSPATIHHFFSHHLVESPNGEELLLVLQIRMHSSTVGFQVFVADLSRKMWIRKETLGDRVIIIKDRQTLFLSAASVGHGVKGNCICFSSIFEASTSETGQTRFTGQTPLKMFDLDSETMTDVSIPYPSKSGHVMFVPNIC